VTNLEGGRVNEKRGLVLRTAVIWGDVAAKAKKTLYFFA